MTINFDNVLDTGTPMSDVLKFTILDRRLYCNETMKEYEKFRGQGKSVSTYVFRSAVLSLFVEVRSALKKDLPETDFNIIEKKVNSIIYSDLLEGLYFLDEWLYKKKITMFDGIKPLPMSLVKRNKAHGWG